MYNDGSSELYFNLYHMKISTIILVMVVAVVAIGTLAYILRKKKAWKTLTIIGIIFSVAAILFATLYSRTVPGRHIELVPFYDMVNAEWPESIVRTYFQNIILFCPLGLFLPFVLRCKMPAMKTILIGFSFSIIIEITQYVFSLGYSEVNDVIMNTLGTSIGCLAYSLKETIEKLVSKTRKE